MATPSRPQFDLITSDKQVNLFLAGQGSGKTYAAGLLSGMLISEYPKVHGFIGANTYPQLTDSTLFRIRNVWRELFGWKEMNKTNPDGCFTIDVRPPAHFNTEGHEYDSYYGKICFEWGTVLYKGSLENYKAHDGKEFAWAILDETKDTREAAVKEVILGRLRESGMMKNGLAWNPLFIFTSPAKVEWINDWFSLDDFAPEITSKIYSKETYFTKTIDNKFVVISSTYHNESHLPSNYIENQAKNLHSALQNMLIFGDPFAQTGGEFYKCFLRELHVGIALYDMELPIHLSYDFNVNPYMTGTIWQIKGKEVRQIDEICLKNPLNTTAAVCREFIRRYGAHKSGLFVYGDPSGRQEDTRSEKGWNDFYVIKNELQKMNPSFRVGKKAPAVVPRGNFINTVFEKNFGGLKIIISSKCSNSISDLIYLKEAADGTKLKEKYKDEASGVTYERWGHTSDSMDYFLCEAYADEFYRHQNGEFIAPVKTGANVSANRW